MVIALLLGVASLAGCSRSDQPALGQVQGSVVLDGKPLKKATVSFHPADKGRQSCGYTDKDGHYQLTYLRDIMGAKVGQHKITIRTAGAEDTEAAHAKELVPAKYNAQTTLERAVKGGENHFDFDLSTK